MGRVEAVLDAKQSLTDEPPSCYAIVVIASPDLPGSVQEQGKLRD
jgi:phage tail protein X